MGQWDNFQTSNLQIFQLQVARQLSLDGIVREGVYVMVGGPNYETVAELKMLKELGKLQGFYQLLQFFTFPPKKYQYYYCTKEVKLIFRVI